MGHPPPLNPHDFLTDCESPPVTHNEGTDDDRRTDDRREHHAPAELRAERLDRLGLARAGGAERVAAEPQRERVRQREVAAVGERRLHEPLAEVEVLEAVPEEEEDHGGMVWWWGWWWWSHTDDVAPTSVFRGVTLRCVTAE